MGKAGRCVSAILKNGEYTQRVKLKNTQVKEYIEYIAL
jgi:hypothetical protein